MNSIYPKPGDMVIGDHEYMLFIAIVSYESDGSPIFDTYRCNDSYYSTRPVYEHLTAFVKTWYTDAGWKHYIER